MMNLFVPSSVNVSKTLPQLGLSMPFVFCWIANPLEGDGHETTAVLLAVRAMDNNGAPAVWTRTTPPQKPPLTAVAPLNRAPVSGWPTVPRTVLTPPVLAPPPPAIANRGTRSGEGVGTMMLNASIPWLVLMAQRRAVLLLLSLQASPPVPFPFG